MTMADKGPRLQWGDIMGDDASASGGVNATEMAAWAAMSPRPAPSEHFPAGIERIVAEWIDWTERRLRADIEAAEREIAAVRLLASGARRSAVAAHESLVEETARREALSREVDLLREALAPFADILVPDALSRHVTAGFAARRSGGAVTYADLQRAAALFPDAQAGQDLAHG